MRFRPLPVAMALGCLLLGLLLSLLSNREVDVDALRRDAKVVEGVTPEGTVLDYDADLRRLGSFGELFQGLEQEMQGLRASVKLEERGYYSNDEHERVVGLLYRYLVARESLWDLIAVHARSARGGVGEPREKSMLVALYAASLLRDASSKMVEAFYENDRVISKLNEGYHDLGIHKGTFDTLFMQLTSLEAIAALEDAYETFEVWLASGEGRWLKDPAQDVRFEGLVVAIPGLYEASGRRIESIMRKSSLALPTVRNRLRHNILVKGLGSSIDESLDALYAFRGKVSDTFTGIKSPLSELAEFGPEERELLRSYLKPGDILLTYTEGYMSNIFLPGLFKHGITYVGTAEERRALGLKEWDLGPLGRPKREEYWAAVDQAKTPSGRVADLVEAVAEGVVFNALDEVLETHVNRLLVLRPVLSLDELRAQLAKVLLLVGDGYDFNFDFTSVSHHCCTEVIYRSLHGKGDIRFELVNRLGLQTLSADDIIGGFMADPGKAFEFVAFAEEEGPSSALARIHAGEAGFAFFQGKWAER